MRVKFITLGCKVNQYETQALSEELVACGAQLTKQKADIYVINSCSVTRKADLKSREQILKAKKENPNAKIILIGCLTAHNKNFLTQLPVDYIVDQNKKHQLASILFPQVKKNKNIWSLRVSRFAHWRAFVKIQDGCDNFCAYCKIPHIRGRSNSRNYAEVIAEIKRLSVKYPEIVLCGINLGLYGRDFKPKTSLGDLVGDILVLSQLKRLRLSSLEPGLIGLSLINLFKHPKLCKHLHLPFQSGDDKILKAMGKKETSRLYKTIVARLRKIDKYFAVSCDIMTGFPGEDDKSFQKTLDFLKVVRPMRMHVFKFSPRDKTKLSQAKLINSKIITVRAQMLRDLSVEFALEYARQFLGKRLEIVAEEVRQGYTLGYSRNYLRVKVKAKLTLGLLYPVKIISVTPEQILGSLIG